MPAKRKDCDETATAFDVFRFRFFVSLAMRLILIRDGIAMRGRSSKQANVGFHTIAKCAVMSGPRRLEGQLVLPVRQANASVLILHGIGERLDYWNDAQQFLASHAIASLIIDYSGYGKSGGAITPANLRQDAIAGYAELQQLVPAIRLPFVLGLSMGTGVAVESAPYLNPAPAGIILCEAFSSLRDAAAAACRTLPVLRYLSGGLSVLVPDLYQTASTVGRIGAPLLIVHSDADELFPVEMAREIFAAANSKAGLNPELVIPHGYAHNDAYLRPSLGYWQPILDFIGRKSGRSYERPPSSPKR